MERLTAALEMFKQQRRRPPEAQPAVAQPAPSRAAPANMPGPIVYTQTRSVQVPAAFLRERRVVAGFGEGPFTDAYRILRTQIMHRLRENNWNVLAISSPGEGEGKTLTAINLAISLALDTTQTVLLVDADLRHPRVHEVFNLPAGPGLTDYLLDDVPIKELLVNPGIDRLVLLPGGRRTQHSAEILTSLKMIALVGELKHRYPDRVVIFDLPPLLQAADVLAFTPYTDATLLVVEGGRTTVEDVEQALQLLKGATPVIGTVLNKSEESSDAGKAGDAAGIGQPEQDKKPAGAKPARSPSTTGKRLSAVSK